VGQLLRFSLYWLLRIEPRSTKEISSVVFVLLGSNIIRGIPI